MREMTSLVNDTAVDPLELDLSDLPVEEIELLVQEGSKGIPDFAASSCDQCDCGYCSCSSEDQL